MPQATLYAGVPAHNAALYRRIRFSVGDPAAIIDFTDGDQPGESTLIIRDIEMDRARRHARAGRVASPADFAPAGGLSGERQTATAQATAECLRRAGVERVRAHADTPLIFADTIRNAGVEVVCDPELGVREQRQKDEQELAWLREAQAMTERAMQMACEMVARAEAGADGVLRVGGEELTSERVRAEIDVFLLRNNYANPACIVAGGPRGADCHDRGSGPLRTGEPIIIDIYPQNRQTQYCGDCTRTIVHGEAPDEVRRMHETVRRAKAAAIGATRAGVTGQAVHEAAAKVIRDAGYQMGLHQGEQDRSIRMVHGTGHGIGLEVHEPPLLDAGGPELLDGDVLTIEPGLYGPQIGGLRIEDMVAVTRGGCDNFNTLHEGLDWR